MFFKLCHAQRAALTVAGMGMSAVILIFVSTFFEFDWYSHRTGVDIIALAFLFIYLVIGTMVHYEVIVGIRKQSSHYLLPFIIVYAPTMGTEALFIVIHMLHIHSPTLDFAYREEANGLYIFFIVVLIITLIIQGAMLAAVCQCRYYLSCKEMHLAALKVAESSVCFFPFLLQIVRI
ncbi:unnamed protein product [Gongylonema pulchrum]|uniref:MARVEL domain-containing protein n=1 Tax=Gongylonema pulchrum TaxID=637853 RepID=A0A183DVI5_9BILA|nr:unnamed protein product [Gongylonema pulchrum]